MLLRHVLGPLFYWTDMNGRDHRPSHSKIMVTWTVLWVTPLLVSLGGSIVYLSWNEKPLSGYLVSTFITTLIVVISACFGADVWKTALKTRFGGATDTVTEAIRQAPVEIKATTERIQALRRQSSAEHEGTEAT